MKNNNNHGSDEVEQLLQAAQDEMLLKLSVDSHIANISSNYLNADLDRRFQALKSRPSVPQSQSDLNVNVDDELKSTLGDRLSARFAALKGSSSSSTNDNNTGHEIHDGDDGEDEVEKIIRWAKDAARLDPSPPSDDDTDKNSDHETDSDSDSDEEPQRRRKQNNAVRRSNSE